MRRIYLITRDLHLYVGLFLSPFILVFSISVFYLVHGLALRPAPDSGRSFAYSHQSERPAGHRSTLACIFCSSVGSAEPPSGPLAFQLSRPGLVIEVKADLESGRATLQGRC
jgi:hypothetical protein